MKNGSLLLALMVAGATLGAQTPASSAEAPHAVEATASEHHGGCEEYAPGDYISPHITDAHCLEVPNGLRFWETREVELPRFAPIQIGPLKLDLSPTKHVVFLLFAAFLCCVVLITAARAHVRHTHAIGRPKGFASGIEAMVLYIRNEVAIPNLGPHGEGYAPFILTLFFF
ncbi:MAG: hypothetical protein ABI625_19095, partial [bacterium]